MAAGLRNRRSNHEHLVFLLATVLALLLVSPLASAQTTNDRNRDRELGAKERIEEELASAQLRLGPFYVISAFELGDLGIGIDEDIYLPTELETEEIVLSIRAPQKVYLVPHRKFMLSADVTPGYLYFTESDDLRRLNYVYRGDVHFLFNRFYLDFWGLTSDELTRNISEFRRLVPQTSDAYGMGGELKLSSRTAATFAMDRRDLDFGEVDLGLLYRDIDVLERDETHYTASLHHNTFPITDVSIGVDVTEFDFVLPEASDARQELVHLQLQQIRAGRTLTIRPGYTRLVYDDPGLEDYEGFLGSVSVRSQPSSKWGWGADAERRLEFSAFGENQHYAADRVSLQTERRMNRRLSVHLLGQKGFNRYFVETPTSVSGTQVRRDDLWYAAAGFLFRIGRLETGLTYGRWERDSNVEGFDDDGIRLMLHLSFNPGLP